MAEEKEHKYVLDEVNEHGEYIKVGGSPVPGITLRQVLRGHTDTIGHISWSPDGNWIASPSKDKTVRIWNSKSGGCIALLTGHSANVPWAAWSPDGSFIASGGMDNSLRIWSFNEISSLSKSNINITKIDQAAIVFKDLKSWVTSVSWSSDGKRIAFIENSNRIGIFDIKSKTVVKSFGENRARCLSIEWLANEEIIASAHEDDGNVYIWNTADGSLISSWCKTHERR